MIAEYTLPWPAPALWPNGKHGHWSVKAKARASYKSQCAWMLIAQGVSEIEADRVSVSVSFHPPDARRRDLDNMTSAMKSGLDALSEAIGVDDSNWLLSISKGEIRKPGIVAITVEPLK